MESAPSEADGMVALNQHVLHSPVLAMWMNDSEKPKKALFCLSQYPKWLIKSDIKLLGESWNGGLPSPAKQIYR